MIPGFEKLKKQYEDKLSMLGKPVEIRAKEHDLIEIEIDGNVYEIPHALALDSAEPQRALNWFNRYL
jgi:hypothetical protein